MPVIVMENTLELARVGLLVTFGHAVALELLKIIA